MSLFPLTLKKRLILGSLLIIALSLSIALLFSLSSFTSLQRQFETSILSDHLAYLNQRSFDYEDYDEYAQSFSVRITLIEQSGEVLYDSDFEPLLMDNHLMREEIRQAKTQAKGYSTRSSIHMNKLVTYVATTTPDGSFLRVSRSYDVIQAWVRYHLRNLLASFVALGILTFTMIVLNTRSTTKALQILTDTALQYQKGNLSHSSTIKQPKEYSLLNDTLKEMAKQLQTTFNELGASAVKYQALLDAMQDGVVLIDRQKTILISNTAFDRMFNQAENTEGLSIDAFLDTREITKVLDDALQAEQLTTTLWIHEEKQYQITPSPILKHGKGVQALVVTISDVTTLKRLEQIKKDFVANVSHELKTPLTAITGFSELANQEQTSLEQLRYFNAIIFANSKRMQTLLEDLLLLASLEDGKTEIPFFALEVESLIRQAIDGCRHLSEPKEIDVQVKIQGNLLVWANEGLLLLALMNLLNNAIMYSEHKSTIQISANRKEHFVCLAVSDQGCGIAKEDQQRIFERFYRVDKARSRKEGGTGLGLAIVKHIVTIHQGTINVQSTVNRGTTFTLCIKAVL